MVFSVTLQHLLCPRDKEALTKEPEGRGAFLISNSLAWASRQFHFQQQPTNDKNDQRKEISVAFAAFKDRMMHTCLRKVFVQ